MLVIPATRIYTAVNDVLEEHCFEYNIPRTIRDQVGKWIIFNAVCEFYEVSVRGHHAYDLGQLLYPFAKQSIFHILSFYPKAKMRLFRSTELSVFCDAGSIIFHIEKELF